MLEDAKSWASLAISLIALGGFLYNWFTRDGSKALVEVSKLRAEMEEDQDAVADKRQLQSDAIVGRFQLVDARLLKLESEITHLPDREQTHRLELAVERLTGRMETLDERLKPVAAISDRLQEFLLEQARR